MLAHDQSAEARAVRHSLITTLLDCRCPLALRLAFKQKSGSRQPR